MNNRRLFFLDIFLVIDTFEFIAYEDVLFLLNKHIYKDIFFNNKPFFNHIKCLY